MTDTSAREIDTPFDSGDYPKAVLLTDYLGDIRGTTCGQCGQLAEDWPKGDYGVPAAMFQASLYCADCMPLSYAEYNGERVSTLTGEPE